MRSIAFYFFGAAVLCVTVGMAWGIQMGIVHDHSMAPAHAHLNLVGWTTMGLFGLYYAVTPEAAAGMLAKLHFVLALIGVLCLVPGIAMSISSGAAGLAIIGSLITAASMLVFLYIVATHGIGKKAA
jgi:hypothetical protein